MYTKQTTLPYEMQGIRINNTFIAKSKNRPLSRIVQISFYIFLISIPFEMIFVSAGVFGSSDSPWSLSRITGLILIIASFTSPGRIYTHISKTIGWFLIYTVIYILSAVLAHYVYDFPFSFRQFNIPWLIMIFVICNGILHDPTTRYRGLKILFSSIGIVAFLQITGLVFNRTSVMMWNTPDLLRVSAFGEDPNFIGARYAVGIIVAMSIMTGIIPSGKLLKIISGFLFSFCLVALVQTGSRGAVISLVIALFALLFSKLPIRKRLVVWFLLVSALVLLILFISMNEGFRSRFASTFEFGDTANRTNIYKSSLNLFLKEPYFGYGSYRNGYILGAEMGGIEADTHNVILWVLLANGIIGFLPFFLGLAGCFLAAWHSRKGPYDVLPLALIVLAITFSQTAGWQIDKMFWVSLAFAASVTLKRPILNNYMNKNEPSGSQGLKFMKYPRFRDSKI